MRRLALVGACLAIAACAGQPVGTLRSSPSPSPKASPSPSPTPTPTPAPAGLAFADVVGLTVPGPEVAAAPLVPASASGSVLSGTTIISVLQAQGTLTRQLTVSTGSAPVAGASFAVGAVPKAAPATARIGFAATVAGQTANWLASSGTLSFDKLEGQTATVTFHAVGFTPTAVAPGNPAVVAAQGTFTLTGTLAVAFSAPF